MSGLLMVWAVTGWLVAFAIGAVINRAKDRDQA
jgi:hypothetical protein